MDIKLPAQDRCNTGSTDLATTLDGSESAFIPSFSSHEGADRQFQPPYVIEPLCRPPSGPASYWEAWAIAAVPVAAVINAAYQVLA